MRNLWRTIWNTKGVGRWALLIGLVLTLVFVVFAVFVTFKFVFIWSFAGTLLFVGLCVVLSLVAGREPPPLFEKVIMATFDLAKIGFGAIVGLLGGKYAQGKPAGATQEEAGSTA